MSKDRIVELNAVVTWGVVEDGCREQPCSGLRPSFSVAGDLIASRVYTLTEGEPMERGGTYKVRIVLPYGGVYSDHLEVGMCFRLHAGARQIASGTVEEILDDVSPMGSRFRR